MAAPADKASAASARAPATPSTPGEPLLPAGTRNGREIYLKFREGLAEPTCEPGASARWRQHFAHAPRQFAATGNDVLPLFGYVVDALREAHLPTEYALIPFVESGYRPGARSASGPAGLWQFIALTARNHDVPIRPGYDGRLSAVESTRAAVRYLKTLHGMFAGDWRLAVMAYNAGEYRVFGALKQAGQRPADADPDALAMPAVTQAYVRKLHALSCLFEDMEGRDQWLQALDRPVPHLQAIDVPAGIQDLDALARRHRTDATTLRRLNPVFADGRIGKAQASLQVLAPSRGSSHTDTATASRQAPLDGFMAMAPPEDELPAPARGAGAAATAAKTRSHTVASGESAWIIARRYDIRVDDLLARNKLNARSVLRPGMTLQIDAAAP
ncbi:lytic transglycosylase domain-containing protein [Luteimonas sp. RIT-PG2_3]